LCTRQPWQAADDKDYSWLSGVVTKHYQGDDGDVRVLGAGVLQAFAGVPVSHEVLAPARRWWLRSAPPRTLVACAGSVTPCSG
jgi:hypothetical protein